MNLTSRIKAAFWTERRRGRKAKEIASRAGIAPSRLSQIVHGHRTLDSDHPDMVKLKKALQIS
jgi:transcriptional regulator with XRE-family HTH domain